MSDLLSLDAVGRVVEPEGKTREYKRDLSSPNGVVKTVVAFANTSGGRLIIGVDDDGRVAGVEDPLAAEERIASIIADSITPRMVPGVDIVDVGGTYVLVIEVPLSTGRPHYLTHRRIEGGTYVRLGSTNRQADQVLIADIERSARGIAFEGLAQPRATVDNLDLAVLPPIGGKTVTTSDLSALGLAVHESGRLVPTNAGILAACPNPDRFLPSAWVQCGRIRGKTRTDIFDRYEFHGPLLRAPDEVIAFLGKHAFVSAQFGAVRRRDVPSIPIEAIREVVVNAIVHANYAEPGTPIRVAFYDDSIEIEGPGLLVAGMTVEGMRNASRLRNPSLARIFRAAGLMENFGTGIRRVYEQLAAAGLPEPRFEEVVDRMRVTIFVPSHAPGGPAAADRNAAPGDAYGEGDDRRHVGRHVGRYDVVMLRAAAQGPVHRDDLLDAAGLSRVAQNYARHVLPLVEAGLLALTVPDKPRSKAQRYALTDAGRAFLRTHQGPA